MTGLKYFHQNYKGCWPHRKIRFLCLELKLAWQRAWKGFDDDASSDFAEYLSSVIPAILRERADKARRWNHKVYYNDTDICPEEQYKIINQLADDLFYGKSLNVVEKLHGEDWLSENIHWQEIWYLSGQNMRSALKLLSEHWGWL